MKLLEFVMSFSLFISMLECKNLPKYLDRCSIKDPEEFSKCAISIAKKAAPQILKGDPDFKVQKLDPLKIPLLQLNAGPTLNLTLTNQIIDGLSTVDIKSITYDKATRKMTWDLLFDFIKLEGDYSIQGRILILPIVGSGKGILNFKKAHLVFSYDVNIESHKNGKQTIRVANTKLQTEFGGATFRMDNLFNGDKVLGDEMNRFLNDNWKEVLTEFEELVHSPMSSILGGVASGFLNNLSFDAAFSTD
ncbi:hypothetical protein HHI36_013482 [Cryptolaemus montrouzieri]|uniref:Uncharacterized protein n=1 Tax=Cryptolaemus montrouzieri TaxID=559131 RepID=A0ABD2NHQ4_9CUCU